MKNKEVEEEPWKRGKKGMKNKEGKEEQWKRGKAKPEQRERERERERWSMKWKRGNLQKYQKASEASFWIFCLRFFLLHFIGHASSFVQV